ncbi:DUF4422 domain-containing protein [Ottowia caeni]|uniref:DUF4422 domain-containing protein n=1 Tax=Ottowia caeni TaxID=2870339 RepID=UPI001E2B4FE4|nr:DUF4422 domain-containing protein [Ottowia caeni]
MLNWRIRYQKIVHRYPELTDPHLSVLEVGSEVQGIAELLQRNITSVNGHIQATPSPWNTVVAGSPFKLPFADNAFDHVVCADGLKYIAKGARALVIAEMTRVARRKVILSMPCANLAVQSDLALAAAFQRMGKGAPPWLHEGITRQLPTVAEMVQLVSGTGLRFEIHTNETVLQHYGGLMLDIFFPFAAQISATEHSKMRHQSVPETGWEMYYSYLFCIFKEHDPAWQKVMPPPARKAAATTPGVGLYAVYHRRLPLAPNTGITPIYVGEAAQAATETERSDTELDNSRWSELSGVHEVWKNGPRTAYVGFCHYRRFFDFSRKNGLARSTTLSFNDYIARAFVTASEHAITHFEKNPDTLIVPPTLEVGHNIWDQYALMHNANDLCMVTNLLVRSYPHLIPYLVESFSTRKLYANNLFITRWDHFEELCALWLDVLCEVEKNVPVRTEDPYQRRDLAFLAERIFDIWVRYRAAQGTNLHAVPMLEITYPDLDTSAWSRTVPPSASAARGGRS